MRLESSRVVIGLFSEAIALCLIISFRFIDIAATVTLAIFNLLYLSLTIHLNGTLTRKLGILSIGNITGLFWNFILQYFAIACTNFFGEQFNIFYAIAYPFLNFMWIVSFWSLSLAALPKPKNTQAEMKH